MWSYCIKKVYRRQKLHERQVFQALLQRHKETGNTEGQNCSGWPRNRSASDERHIILTSFQKMSSGTTCSDLVKTSGALLHPSTVWRSLIKNCHHGRLVAKKAIAPTWKPDQATFLHPKHKNFYAEKCQQLLWTDEFKFKIYSWRRFTQWKAWKVVKGEVSEGNSLGTFLQQKQEQRILEVMVWSSQSPLAATLAQSH